MGLRELLTGAPPQTLGLDAKGFAYSQQGGSSSGVYYGSGYQLLNALERPSSREYAAVRIELSSALAVCLNTVTNAFPEAELCVEREVEDGKKAFAGFELAGKTLGIVGLGKVGALVADAAIQLGMNVVGYDPEITVEAAWGLPSQVQRAASVARQALAAGIKSKVGAWALPFAVYVHVCVFALRV